ncbi:MAG: hypothetical protein KKG76_06215 [Euryarchaeota archaeon]|nr:hypothetical protein [Euryarchaeota archaeon]
MELRARTTIIRKLQIKDGNIILDDLKTKAKKVKVDINEKDIEIESQDDGTAITDGDTAFPAARPARDNAAWRDKRRENR